MEIAVSSWSFRAPLTTGELRLAQVPAACAVLGFDLVELNDRFLRQKSRTERLFSTLVGSTRDQTLPDLRPVVLGRLEKGLRGANAQLICFTAENDFVPDSSEILEDQVRYVKAVIGAARYLDCNLIRLWFTASRERAVEVPASTLDAFREVTETASKAGVRLTLEHRFGHLDELEAIIYVIEQVRSYYLGACLNFGYLSPSDWRTGLDRLVPYTIHVHASSREFDAAGNETIVPYPACIDALKRISYRGFISIEYEGRGDPLDGIVATQALIKRCIAK
jgi:sugar phosphate isomerase/epimerase